MRRIYRKQISEYKLSEELLAVIYNYVMSHMLCRTECDESTLEEIGKMLEGIKPGFVDSLIALIDKKQMKDSEVYNRALITKQTFKCPKKGQP